MLNAALVCLGIFMLLPPASYAVVSLLIMAGRQPTPAWPIIFLAVWLTAATLATLFALLELRGWAKEEKGRRP